MRVQGSTSVAANSSSGNVLSGKIAEIVTRPSKVRFAAVAAAAGVKGAILSGSETLMEESDLSAANRFPLDPDDVIITDVAMPNDRLSLAFRNTTAGALVVQWFVEVLPLK